MANYFYLGVLNVEYNSTGYIISKYVTYCALQAMPQRLLARVFSLFNASRLSYHHGLFYHGR